MKSKTKKKLQGRTLQKKGLSQTGRKLSKLSHGKKSKSKKTKMR